MADLGKLMISLGFDPNQVQTAAKQAGQQSASAFNQSFKANTNTIQNTLTQALSSTGALGKKAGSQFLGSFKSSLKSQMNSFKGFFDSTMGTIFKGGLLGVGFTLGRSLITGIQNAIAAGIGAIKDLVSSSIEIGEQRQASRNRLIAFSGSAQQAAQDFNFVKDAAMRLNNDLNPLLQSFEIFVQQSRSVGLAAKEYQKIWEAIAQAATVSQQADRIPDLLESITEAMLAGTISSDEFVESIATNIPGALEAMERATGKTGKALNEFIDSGVQIVDILPQFAQELLNVTAPALEQQLKGAANEAGNIGGLLEAIKGTIGEAIVPVVGAWRKAIADVLGVVYKNVKGFDSLQDLAQKFADKLAASPEIVEIIGNGISDLVNKALEGTINLASSFTDYLNKNPDTISKIVDGLGVMTKVLTGIVELTGKFLIRLSDAANELATLQKGADRAGLDSFVAQNENITPERYAELEQQARENIDQKLGLSDAPSFLANIQRRSGLYRNMVNEELQKLVQDEIASTSARVRSGQLAQPGVRAPGVRWQGAEQFPLGWQALLTPLFQAEGTNTENGYRTNFGGELIDAPNGHPRRLVTSNGLTSDAYGQWQWKSSTWDDTTSRYGRDPSDMSPINQMVTGIDYFKESIFANGIDQATLDAALAGDLDAAMKVWNAASGRWPSLPGGSQQSMSTDEFVRMYQSIIGSTPEPWNGSYYSDPISEDLSSAIALSSTSTSPTEPTPVFASPLANASPQEVQDYLSNDLTAQQGFWGSRDGGNRTHAGADLDYRIAGGDGYTKGDIVQSILPGIATLERQFGTGQDGDASVMVRVVSQDTAGNQQAIEYGHLSLADVIDQLGLTDFGQSIAVEAGQAIGRIGTIDNISSGAHLDLKWSVNGRYVDPTEAFRAISSGEPGTATSIEGTALPISPVLGSQDPNAIFSVLDEAEKERQRVLQETRANQDEALRRQREQEDAAREAELKRQQIELERVSQQFQGTSVSPFLDSQLETIAVNNQYNEEIIRLQREQEDLQTELDRTLSDRMDEAGIQIYVDSLKSAIAQTEDLLATTEELRQAELGKIAEARQQLTEETIRNQQSEQEQQLAEARATTANLESQRQIESTNSEVVKQLLSLSSELASISAEYDKQTQALQSQIEDLTTTMDKLNSVDGIEIDPAAVEILNNELNHANAMLDELEKQRTIQVDIISAQQQQLFDSIRNGITTDLTNSQIQAASLRGDTELQNQLQRDQARSLEFDRYSSQLEDIQALEDTGNYSASAIAQMRNEAELLNQINLDSINRQFQSLGEQITGSVGQSFSDFFTSIISGTQSIGDAFKGLLSSILSSLMNFLSNKIFTEFMNFLFPTPTAQSGLGGGILGIGTSLLGGLVGDLGGFTGNVVSNSLLSGLTPFAHGGIVSSPTPALVGEAGSEAIIPLKNGAVPVSFTGNVGGGSIINVPVNVNIENSSGNVDIPGVKRLIENTITEKLSREKRPGGLLNR